MAEPDYPTSPQPMLEALVGLSAFSASAAGPIVYRAGAGGGPRQLVCLDRSGVEVSRIGEPSDSEAFSLSPDDRRVAVSFRSVNANVDIWLLDSARGNIVG